MQVVLKGSLQEIVYGGDANFPPYKYLDERGKPAGLNVDLIRAVAQAEGLQVRIRLQPWSMIRAGLASGAVESNPGQGTTFTILLPLSRLRETIVPTATTSASALQRGAGKEIFYGPVLGFRRISPNR